MILKRLYVDYITEPDQEVKERHVLVLGDDQHELMTEISKVDWLELVRLLAKQRKLNTDPKKSISPFVFRCQYQVINPDPHA